MSEPRAWTEEEIREKFLKHVASLAHYWCKESRAKTVEEKLTGVVFSFLVMLDGGACELPGFKVIPTCDPSDKQYHIEQGENWYPDDVDIGGYLHELIGQYFHPDLQK